MVGDGYAYAGTGLMFPILARRDTYFDARGAGFQSVADEVCEDLAQFPSEAKYRLRSLVMSFNVRAGGDGFSGEG